MQRKFQIQNMGLLLGIISLVFLNHFQLSADEIDDGRSEMNLIEADKLGESPEQYLHERGRGSDDSDYWPRCLSCFPMPKVEIHGIIRGDIAHMDRTPQFGTIIQPASIQIPLDKQKEHRHAVTFIDARASSIEVDISHTICDTKVYGMIEIDFDRNLDWGLAGVGNYWNANLFVASLDKAYLRADFPDNWYLQFGYTWNLITVTDIAWPLGLPICDLYAPAGMTYRKGPQFKIGGYRPLCNAPGEINYFVGIEQQWLWTGVDRNPEIALRPARGEPLAYPLLGAGLSWEKWDPFQVDVRFAVSENRFAIKGTRKSSEKLGWLGKVSVQSQIYGPTFYGAYTYMDGMNRFALLAFPDAILNEDNHIENVTGHGLFGGAWFDLCGCVNCNVMAGLAWAKDIHCTSFDDDLYDRYLTGQICFWREFFGHYAASIEYKRWQVKAVNGDSGHMNLYMGTLFFYF